MPEVGQTMLYVDQVGFQRLPDTTPTDAMGAPILGAKEKQYAIILQDTKSHRSYVIPVEENVRKMLVEAMRKAPLDIVAATPAHAGADIAT
jgi:hypothetical protein